MIIPCTLPRSGNYLFGPSARNFADHPVHCTPLIINAANDNLPVHLIYHSDRDVIVSKHTYVGAMEKVQELYREPVSQNALSRCLAHSGLLPSQRQSMHTLLKENSGVFGSSIADFSSNPLVQHYIDTGNAKPIKQGLNFFKLTKSNVDFETNTIETRSTLYLANTHYIQSSNSTIIIPKSDVYQPCQPLLNEKVWWMIALMLTIVIILIAIASHTHCHFNRPLRNRTNPLFHLNVTLLGNNY